MTRASFGGGVADFVVSASAPGDPLRFAAATLTMWDAETGGTQLTDLLLASVPVTSIPVGDDGQVPTFQGPDGVLAMWAQAGAGGGRVMLDAGADIAVLAGESAAAAETARADAVAAKEAAEAVGALADTQIANQIDTPGSATDTALKASIEGTVGVSDAVSAGGRDLITSPSASAPNADVAIILGGTTAFPHTAADGSSLPFFGGGYDSQNRKQPGAASPAILSVFLGAHHMIDAPGGHGSIGGGSYHVIHGDYGRVGGGFQNSVANAYGVVAGGRSNNAGACSKSTVATTAITVGATSLTVGTVTGKAIATGMTLMVDYGVKREIFLNVTVAGSTVTLSGSDAFAKAHSIGAAVYFSDGLSTDATVGGGQANDAFGLQSTVGGGFNNKSRGTACTVAGGAGNIAGASNAANATVGGGSGNVASATGSTIGGGVTNTANGTNATIAGGTGGTASGTASGITHGSANTASGSYSRAGGANAVADHYGEDAFAAGSFSVGGDAQVSTLVARAPVSGANTGELFLDQSAQRITLADNTAYDFRLVTLCYARGSSGTVPNTVVGRWVTEGAIYRKTGAATTTMFSNTKTADAANTAGFDLVASADTTNGALAISGTGKASHAVYFVSRVHLVKITG